MSDKDIQITCNESLQPLADLLQGVRRDGDYFYSGAREIPMPRLEVTGVGTLSFPIPPDQARKVIAAVAERAPYGRGDRTLLDESVRKVWQVPPAKIRLGGTGWQNALDQLVAECAGGLGCEAKAVEAEFYKLLVYDAGGFFAAHRDTEKSGGMFGTLVISLPSEHAGGELVIRHTGRETVTDLCATEPSEIRFAAFYADCEHEVRPVRKGNRVCLVYNLVQKKRAKAASAPDHRAETARAEKILSAWAGSDHAPDKVVYLLEHQYTQASLSFGSLKNADAARARVLREAAARAGCAVHLGIVHIEESGWAEYVGGYHGRSRRWDEEDDEEEDPSEYEIGEVCDGRYFIDQWRDGNDTPTAFGEIPLQDDEILPAGALDAERPDKEHFSEASGNEGASFERTYLRAAVVLWPENRFDEICLSAGVDAAIARLGQYVDLARSEKGAGRTAAATRVSRFAGKLPLVWEPYVDHFSRLDALLRHLARFADPQVLTQTAAAPLASHYDARLNPALVDCARVLDDGTRRSFYGRLVAARGTSHPGGCLTLWTQLAEAFPADAGFLAALSGEILKILTSCKAWRSPKSKDEPRRRWEWDDGDDELADLIREHTPEEVGTQSTSEAVANYLAALHKTLGASSCHQALGALGRNPAAFPPNPLLLPALEHLLRARPPLDPPVLAALWELCADFYLRRSSSPPQEPKDWAMDVRISGPHPLLRELEAFARDPREQTHRFRVRKELRQIVHQAIDKVRLDMTHVTERSGSPQTLVCTKTRATHARARKQYLSDLDDMRRLLKLAPAKTSPTAGRLRRAIPDA